MSSTEFQFFHARFKRVSRPKRETILCAMIRINYGTPWAGDLELLRDFFPRAYDTRLNLGGLTNLIEALSPFADEPTDAGFVVEEPTLQDANATSTLELVGEVTQEIQI